MEIIIADKAGFCFGVKRALELAQGNLCHDFYSLGPLIHNPQVVEYLKNKGLQPVESIEDIPNNSKVIIRSHGVGTGDYKKAKDKSLEVIDGTCPFVKKAQLIAKKLADDGYCVVIVGDKYHPEVKATKEWAGEAYVVSDAEQTKTLPTMNRIGVLAQTTLPQKTFLDVVEVLKRKTSNLKVHNSICFATHSRQDAVIKLSPVVDVMVVIGGRNSSNTCKLAALCRELGTTTYHIEHYSELTPNMFKGVKKAGVTAGASTPDWIIEEVVFKMTEFTEEKKQDEIREEAVPEDIIQDENANIPPENEELQSEPTESEVFEDTQEQPGEQTEEQLEEPLEEPQDEQSVEQIDEQQDDLPVVSLKKGDIVPGEVVQITAEEVLVDVGGKSEGIIPKGEINALEEVQPGDKIEVFVIKPENEEGNPILSKRRADRRIAWDTLQEAFDNDAEISGVVVEIVKGGVLVDVGIRGFVPASLVERGYVENLEDYLEKNLRLKVIELDKSKNKAVLSQKAVLDEEYEAKKQQTWETIEEGQVKDGIVRRLTDFGAFVDIGGVDGLLHVSEISWGRVEHPRDVLEEGQELDVMILGLDREAEKVSLGLKQLQENPWKVADQNYPVGSIVKGKVLRIAPFGAFVEVEPGVEGLVHISQLAEEHVERTEDVLNIGDIVDIKVLSVDTEAQRMSLSVKDAKPKKPVQKKETKEFGGFEQDTTGDSGVTIGDLYGDLLKGNDTE